MEDRDRGRVFGEVADLYDRVRRPYPEELFDELLDYAGRPPAALDIGAGTGRASEPLAARGVRVTAVEPDAAMAAILARRVPDARVERCAFEEYRPDAPFGLVCSAEAWHWSRRPGPRSRSTGCRSREWSGSPSPAGAGSSAPGRRL